MNNALTEHGTDRSFWIAAAVAGLNATVIRAFTGTASGAVGPIAIALLTGAALLRLRRAPDRAAAGLRRPTTG